MRFRFTWLLLANALYGCAATPTLDVPLRPFQPALPKQAMEPANTRLAPIIGITPESSYSIPAPLISPSGAAAGSGTSLDFADVDIRTVVSEILGQILHVNYTIDPRVHGTATFHSSTSVSSDQLLPLLQSLLAENGATLVQSGTLYNVVPAADGSAGGPSAAPATLAGGAAIAGSAVVPLRYASAADMVAALQPFIGPGGRIAAAPSGNAVIIAGDSETRQTLLDLVTTFDVDTLAGQSYTLLPISTGGAKDMASSLQTALQGKSALGDVQIVPLTRIDAILVIAAKPGEIDDVRRVYSLIERNQSQTTRSWNVYYLQASDANNLAYVLQQAFTPDDVTAVPDNAQPDASSSAGAAASGATSSAGTGVDTSNGLGTSASSLGDSAIGSQSSALPAVGSPQAGGDSAASANPLLGGLGGASDATGAATDSMRIIPDSQNNSLLIYATQSEDDLVNTMLAKIDVLPLEVRIDAVIAEVDLNNTLQYGTQFFFKTGGLNGILNNATSTLTDPAATALNASFPGFILAGNGAGGAPIAISALNAVTKVQVLSSPELMVLNNTTAQLQVGSLVPYLTTSSQSTIGIGSPVINSIGYQPTGVIMQVTPRVDQDGLIMLKIAQNVSSVGPLPSSTAAIQSPTFLQRSISTSVVVEDGQTVGLAGLINDNASTSNQGIPWLKDIPILGFLAGSQNNVRMRTELLVLLTPYVVYNQHDARALTEDLQESLPNAAAVPYSLTRPPEGSDDPNLAYRPVITP